MTDSLDSASWIFIQIRKSTVRKCPNHSTQVAGGQLIVTDIVLPTTSLRLPTAFAFSQWPPYPLPWNTFSNFIIYLVQSVNQPWTLKLSQNHKSSCRQANWSKLSVDTQLSLCDRWASMGAKIEGKQCSAGKTCANHWHLQFAVVTEGFLLGQPSQRVPDKVPHVVLYR